MDRVTLMVELNSEVLSFLSPTAIGCSACGASLQSHRPSTVERHLAGVHHRYMLTWDATLGGTREEHKRYFRTLQTYKRFLVRCPGGIRCTECPNTYFDLRNLSQVKVHMKNKHKLSVIDQSSPSSDQSGKPVVIAPFGLTDDLDQTGENSNTFPNQAVSIGNELPNLTPNNNRQMTNSNYLSEHCFNSKQFRVETKPTRVVPPKQSKVIVKYNFLDY